MKSSISTSRYFRHSFKYICPQFGSATSRCSSTVSSPAVSAALIKELREKSNAPILDCKKALMATEVNGDISKAMDWLRAKGISRAANHSDRAALEGLIALYVTPGMLSLVEVNSETDFVGRNKDFQNFVARVAATAHSCSETGIIEIETLMNKVVTDYQSIPIETDKKTVRDALGDIISSIRENIVIRRAYNLRIPSQQFGVLSSYIHGRIGVDVLPSHILLGKTAGVVSLAIENSGDNTTTTTRDIIVDQVAKLGSKLAMHVVAAKPMYLNTASVPTDVIERETAIIREQSETAAAGTKKKSEEILMKAITGRLNKRLAELCLLNQNHVVEEGNPQIQMFLKSFSASLAKEVAVDSPLNISVNTFQRWSVGQSTS